MSPPPWNRDDRTTGRRAGSMFQFLAWESRTMQNVCSVTLRDRSTPARGQAAGQQGRGREVCVLGRDNNRLLHLRSAVLPLALSRHSTYSKHCTLHMHGLLSIHSRCADTCARRPNQRHKVIQQEQYPMHVCMFPLHIMSYRHSCVCSLSLGRLPAPAAAAAVGPCTLRHKRHPAHIPQAHVTWWISPWPLLNCTSVH